jgi:hypothetical protein
MNIAALEDQIRDRINSRRKQHELISRVADWNKLCSALDVIGDTEFGLTAYLEHPAIEDTGLCYLHVYGALQLLQTQQDAVEQVCRALGVRPKASPKIPAIREVRSSAVGHPTAQQEDNVTKSNFIVRASLSQHGFSLMTVFSDDRQFIERQVSVPELVNQQREALAATLEEVIQTLDAAEMKHRETFRDERLTDCFPPTLGYFFSKVFEAIHSPRYFPLGKMHVDLVAECLAKMKALLEKRGEWGIYDSINYEYELLEYPLFQLRTFFEDPAASKLSAKDAFIFASFVRTQFSSLQSIAEEIDEKYASSPARDA